MELHLAPSLRSSLGRINVRSLAAVVTAVGNPWHADPAFILLHLGVSFYFFLHTDFSCRCSDIELWLPLCVELVSFNLAKLSSSGSCFHILLHSWGPSA